jgi:hypothetical protein
MAASSSSSSSYSYSSGSGSGSGSGHTTSVAQDTAVASAVAAAQKRIRSSSHKTPAEHRRDARKLENKARVDKLTEQSRHTSKADVVDHIGYGPFFSADELLAFAQVPWDGYRAALLDAPRRQHATSSSSQCGTLSEVAADVAWHVGSVMRSKGPVSYTHLTLPTM